jgi:hypothetical protein
MSIASNMRNRLSTRKPQGGGGYFPLDGEGSISDFQMEVIGYEIRQTEEFRPSKDAPGVPCQQIRFKVKPVEQHPDAVDWPDPDNAPEFMTSAYKAWAAALYSFENPEDLGDKTDGLKLSNEARQDIVRRNEEAYIRYINVLGGRPSDEAAGEDFAELEEAVLANLDAGQTATVSGYVWQGRVKPNEKFAPRVVMFDSLISG